MTTDKKPTKAEIKELEAQIKADQEKPVRENERRVRVGVAVALLYYRREQGTALWVPRGMARFLANRAKATKQTAEAFTLGLGGSLGELLFTIAPLFIAALALTQLDKQWQLAGIGIYLLASLSSLLVINGMIGAGHSLSKIQKWREKNKKFLQISAGILLFILGLYVYVEHVILANVMTATGAL